MKGKGWIDLVQDKVQWLAFVNTVKIILSSQTGNLFLD